MRIGRVNIKLEFKKEDLWVGVFWKKTPCFLNFKRDNPLFLNKETVATNIWICLLPCLPIHITIWNKTNIEF